MLRHHLPTVLAAVVLTTIAATAQQNGPEWSQWRGPNRDGISTEKLNAEGQSEPLWKTNVGIGYSTVAIKNGLLYTVGHDKEEEEDTVFCFEAKTGKEVWSHTYPCKTMAKAHRGGSLTTPSVDGDRVWVLNREGKLFVYDAKTGKVRWKKDTTKAFKAKLPTWGFASSPLILKEMVVLNVGRIVAMNRKGKTIWKTKKNYGAGYSTAVDATIGQRKCLLVLNGTGLILLDRKTGKQLATHEFKTRHDVNAATPVVIGDKVFLSGGYGHGCEMVTVSPNKKRIESVWESEVMRNHMAGCTHFEGHLYGFDETRFKCLDLDGDEKWAMRFGKAAHVIADGKLVVITSRGELVIGTGGPDGFEELSRNKVLDGGVYWTTPVVVGGLIYCRNSHGDLVCIDHRG